MHQYVHGAYERRYACVVCAIKLRQFGANLPMQTIVAEADDGTKTWSDIYTADIPLCTEGANRILAAAKSAWAEGRVAVAPDDHHFPYNF